MFRIYFFFRLFCKGLVPLDGGALNNKDTQLKIIAKPWSLLANTQASLPKKRKLT